MSNTTIEIDNKCYIVKCGNFNINLKKLSLIFILSGALLIFEEYRSLVYIPIISFVCSLVLFWNYPILILFTNSRPMYYEDLFIYDWNVKYFDIDKYVKKKFENIFNVTLIVSNSLFIAALSDYLFYETKEEMSYIEIIGVSGGIFKIFQMINHINGTILLYLTRRLLVEEIKKEKTIELTNNDGLIKSRNNRNKINIGCNTIINVNNKIDDENLENNTENKYNN